ncbi:MAG: hypothetical protein HY302_10780 [Opitutae bacterium]|nr:hypothetical protein [Opitutae bacterium]
MLDHTVRIPKYYRRRLAKEMRPMLDTCRRASGRPFVHQIIESVLSVSVVARCRITPAAKMHAEDMGFLRRAMNASRQNSFSETMTGLVRAFSGHFRTVRAFHGCRPASFEPYLTHGLLPLSRELLSQHAYSLFAGKISRDEADVLVAKADLSTRLGVIHFGTDPRAQISEYGHYLIDGPESLCRVFDGARFSERRERRRQLGVPTMIDCAVPLELISPERQANLARHVITAFFSEQSDIPDEDSWDNDCSVILESPLSPKNILGHFHPAEIYDAHGDGAPYRSPVTKCRWCAEWPSG